MLSFAVAVHHPAPVSCFFLSCLSFREYLQRWLTGWPQPLVPRQPGPGSPVHPRGGARDPRRLPRHAEPSPVPFRPVAHYSATPRLPREDPRPPPRPKEAAGALAGCKTKVKLPMEMPGGDWDGKPQGGSKNGQVRVQERTRALGLKARGTTSEGRRSFGLSPAAIPALRPGPGPRRPGPRRPAPTVPGPRGQGPRRPEAPHPLGQREVRRPVAQEKAPSDPQASGSTDEQWIFERRYTDRTVHHPFSKLRLGFVA